jgi:hypothetical protein
MDFVLTNVSQVKFAAPNTGMIRALPAESAARFSILLLCAA